MRRLPSRTPTAFNLAAFAVLAACDIPPPSPEPSSTGEACVMTTGGDVICPPTPAPEQTTAYVEPLPADPCMSPGLPCLASIRWGR